MRIWPRGVVAAVLVTASVLAGASAHADANLAALTQETRREYQDATSFEIVWWVPVEIWTAALSDRPQAASEAAEVYADHLVFLVAEADLSLGAAKFRPAERTRERFRLLAPDDVWHAPLPEAEVPADLRVALSSLLPALAKGAGEVGQNFRPLVFDAEDGKGRRIASATKPGRLEVRLGERSFVWRLPLAALLPPKRCPVDGEKLSGAFEYCPYHGKRLEPLE